MSNLTLIIPAKNEKESLPLVLDELKIYKYTILVILHPSDKETINAIKDFDVEIVYQNGKGYGDALIQGIENVKTDLFAIFNADGSFNPKELENMHNIVNSKRADFVFGSRYMKDAGSDDDTNITFIGNKIFTFIGNFFFKLRISDILYTFVLGNTVDAKSLGLKQKDFGFCVELPIKAKRNGKVLLSTSSYERARIAGIKKVKPFRDGIYILIKMIKLFFRLD